MSYIILPFTDRDDKYYLETCTIFPDFTGNNPIVNPPGLVYILDDGLFIPTASSSLAMTLYPVSRIKIGSVLTRNMRNPFIDGDSILLDNLFVSGSSYLKVITPFNTSTSISNPVGSLGAVRCSEDHYLYNYTDFAVIYSNNNLKIFDTLHTHIYKIPMLLSGITVDVYVACSSNLSNLEVKQLVPDEYGVEEDSIEYLGNYYVVPEYTFKTSLTTTSDLPSLTVDIGYEIIKYDTSEYYNLKAIISGDTTSASPYTKWEVDSTAGPVDRVIDRFNPNLEYSVVYDVPHSSGVINAKVTLLPFNISISRTINVSGGNSPYESGGNSGSGGGGGSFGSGETSDPTTPLIPSGSVELNSSKSGLFTLYKLDSSQLESLGSELYAETILEKLKLEVMQMLWNSPIEGVISCLSYPFNIPQATVGVPMKFGSLELETLGNVLASSHMTIDWGTISLSEYWGNFLDYAPHTQVELYLPWGVGFVHLNPHDCLPGTIGVVTNIDIAKGICVHHVTGNHGIIGTYSGICASQFPLTAIDTGGKTVAMTIAACGALVAGASVAAAGTTAGKAAITEAAGNAFIEANPLRPDLRGAARYSFDAKWARNYDNVTSSAVSKYTKSHLKQLGYASSSAIAAARTPAQVQRSGSFSNAGVGLAPQEPFVIISRPEQNVPEGYGHMYGYPSNISAKLSTLAGYTEIGSIHLENFGTATMPELNEIEELLIGGVIL